MGLELFLEHIIKPPIKDHVIDAILSQVQHERDGYAIHRSTVKGCTDIFLTLESDKAGTTVYKRDFEPIFLTKSEAFYCKEGKELVDSLDSPEFLRVVSHIFVYLFLPDFQ
jgi:cullin 3